MKCGYCGNNLNIEEKFCPYCGKENTFAKEHQESMEHYDADYTATKEDVYEETRRFKTKTIRITILAVMIAVAAGLFILAMSADDLKYSRMQKSIEANSGKYKAEINALMDARDYLAVDEYFDAKHISYSTPMEEYYAVEQASNYYAYYYGNILELLERNIEDGIINHFRTTNEILTDIGKNIGKINEACKVEKWYEERGCYTPEKMAYMDDLQAQVAVLAQAYLGISEEDAEQLSTMSEARIIVMLEDSYNG